MRLVLKKKKKKKRRSEGEKIVFTKRRDILFVNQIPENSIHNGINQVPENSIRKGVKQELNMFLSYYLVFP